MRAICYGCGIPFTANRRASANANFRFHNRLCYSKFKKGKKFNQTTKKWEVVNKKEE